MKKFLFFTLGLFLLGGAASAQDVVYLRNGSMIRGSVLEQEVGKSIKVQTQDGSIFIYSMSEVERIAKDKEPVRQRNTNAGTNDYTSLQERHRGLDFNVDLGYHIATKGGSGSFFTQLGLGKRFNANFYWGLGAGVSVPVSSGSKPTIPITSDFRLYFPFHTSKLVMGGTMRLGYAINTADDITVGSGKYQQTVEVPNAVMIQLLPTLTVPLSRRTDLNVGIGYTHFIATKGGSGSGAVTISTGFNFGRPLSLAAKPNKPKKPTFDRGIQLSLDLGASGIGNQMTMDFGLAASYQLDPHLAVGLGFGFDGYVTGEGDIYEYENCDYEIGLKSAYRLFARGVYRLNEKKFSPIAACDIGLRFVKWDHFSWAEFSSSRTHFFIAPAVGGSLRMGSNSYMDLKVGYQIEKDLSGLFLKLGFTHTFGWGFGKK